MARFERLSEPLLSRSRFLFRLARHLLFSSLFIAVSLGIGVIGYRHYEGMSWIDAFVNAAMILGGMGPVEELKTDGGKLFAGIYALYSGLVVIVAIGIMAAPIFHRYLHRFHMETD